jgi:hypothetical protein
MIRPAKSLIYDRPPSRLFAINFTGGEAVSLFYWLDELPGLMSLRCAARSLLSRRLRLSPRSAGKKNGNERKRIPASTRRPLAGGV